MELSRKSARVWSKAKAKAQTSANAKEINLKRRKGSKVEKRMKGEINCWGVPLFLDQHFVSLTRKHSRIEQEDNYIRQKRIAEKL